MSNSSTQKLNREMSNPSSVLYIHTSSSINCHVSLFLPSFRGSTVRLALADAVAIGVIDGVVISTPPGAQKRDPILKMSEDYVMAGRVAAILRGLAYAVKHKPSVAKLWAPQARELLVMHDRLTSGKSSL